MLSLLLLPYRHTSECIIANNVLISLPNNLFDCFSFNATTGIGPMQWCVVISATCQPSYLIDRSLRLIQHSHNVRYDLIKHITIIVINSYYN